MARSAEETEAMEEFRAAILMRRCIVCNRTNGEAMSFTGYGHQAHHGIRRQVLRRLGLPEWSAANSLCVCEEPCHRRHTARVAHIPRESLPDDFIAWCFRNNLTYELEREYPYEEAA